MGINVKFVVNTDKILEALDEQIYKSLEEIGMMAQDYAADITPVNKRKFGGRLRNSITFSTKKHDGHTIRTEYVKGVSEDERIKEKKETVHTTEENTVIIGTNVHYARWIEEGHRSYPPQHMLKRAISNHSDEYMDVLERGLKGE